MEETQQLRLHHVQRGSNVSTLSSSDSPASSNCAPVFLNVYDMQLGEYAVNHYTYCIGLGVFHTGVEVYGREIAFGGHPYDSSGCFAIDPKGAAGVMGPGVVLRRSIYMGTTSLSKQQVQQLVDDLGLIYPGNEYHILRRNCNDFSGDFVFRLTGKRTPAWVNRLAQIGICCKCFLPEAFTGPTNFAPEVASERLEDPRDESAYLLNQRNMERS